MPKKHRYKHDGIAHLFVLPAYSVYLVFVLLPVLMTIFFSFTNYDLYTRMDFTGLHNYRRLLQDQYFLQSLRNTLVYAVFTIIPQLAVGLLLALILNRGIRGKGLLRLSFYLPYLVSMVSVSMLWLWMYDPNTGILNKIIQFFGLPPQRWLFDPNLALGSIIVMSIWKFMGYNMLIFLAGLQQIPESLYEAADIEGASSWQKFTRITFPLLQPTTFFLFVIATINCFAVFEQVNVMTDGGPMNETTTVVHQLYIRGFTEFQMGYACSMGVVLIAITMILTFTNFRFGKEGKDIEMG